MKKLNQEEIVTKLNEGWQLGFHNWAGRMMEARAWMQLKLCCGGDSFNVDLRSLNALIRSGKITPLPRRRGDAYWLIRYGMVK